MNLIDACIDKGVKRIVALSTDKASSQQIFMERQSLRLTACLSQETLTQEVMIRDSRLFDTATLWVLVVRSFLSSSR